MEKFTFGWISPNGVWLGTTDLHEPLLSYIIPKNTNS